MHPFRTFAQDFHGLLRILSCWEFHLKELSNGFVCVSHPRKKHTAVTQREAESASFFFSILMNSALFLVM
jgi:hypothetical protein